MQASLVNIRKLVVESPKNALKMKNWVKEDGASESRVKKENESTKAQA
jgi:hypothetical protein